MQGFISCRSDWQYLNPTPIFIHVTEFTIWNNERAVFGSWRLNKSLKLKKLKRLVLKVPQKEAFMIYQWANSPPYRLQYFLLDNWSTFLNCSRFCKRKFFFALFFPFYLFILTFFVSCTIVEDQSPKLGLMSIQF